MSLKSQISVWKVLSELSDRPILVRKVPKTKKILPITINTIEPALPGLT
jgi:hypothetical protein